MAERVDLTTPVAHASTTNYHLERMTADFDANTILLQLRGNNGEILSHTYGALTAPTGSATISALNISDNSQGTSLVKRIYNRLVTDGILAGTVSGTPQ